MNVRLFLLFCSILINYSCEQSFSFNDLKDNSRYVEHGKILQNKIKSEIADLLTKYKTLPISYETIDESVTYQEKTPDLIDIEMIIRTLMTNENQIGKASSNQTEESEKKNEQMVSNSIAYGVPSAIVIGGIILTILIVIFQVIFKQRINVKDCPDISELKKNNIPLRTI